MNGRLVLGLVLAAVAGGLIATAASFAYAQSSTPQSNYGYNGSSGGNYHCGMMCRGGMGQWGMGQGQGYPATWDQNTTRWCC